MGSPAVAPLPKPGDEPVEALVGSVTPPAEEQFTEADKHEPAEEEVTDEETTDDDESTDED